MSKVINKYGVEIDFAVAVQLMDNDIREELHRQLAPCSDQDFFDTYADAHEIEFGEEWEFAKENPIY